MTSPDGLRNQIREAVIHAECERPGKCPDCITDSVLSVVAAGVARSAQAARECARNTDAAAEMIRTALQTAHHHGPAEGIRVLTKMALNVDGLLDGLDLPAAESSAPDEPHVEHDDGACSECGSTEGDIWPIAGKPGYFCRACCIKLTGADPAQPAPVSDLLGVDPDWLGGQSVDDYVRDSRRA